MPTDATLDDLPSSRGRRPGWPTIPTRPPARSCGIAIEAARGGDVAAVDDLADRFAGTLQFGTAGPARNPRRRLEPDEPRRRHPGRGGPDRLPEGRRLAAAPRRRPPPPPSSSASTPATTPTSSPATPAPSSSRPAAAPSSSPAPCRRPLLAFAIRHLGADAGVMVTASHNPPRDNGYKVYLGDGSQIVPPADVEIAARIDAVESVARRSPGRTPAGPSSARRSSRPTSTPSSRSSTPRPPASCRSSTRRCTASAATIVLRAFERAGFPPPGRRRRAGRARPRLPDRPLPEPGGAGRDGPRPRRRPARPPGRRHRQRPRRRPLRRGRPRPRGGHRRPTPRAGGCSAATRSASSWART